MWKIRDFEVLVIILLTGVVCRAENDDERAEAAEEFDIKHSSTDSDVNNKDIIYIKDMFDDSTDKADVFAENLVKADVYISEETNNGDSTLTDRTYSDDLHGTNSQDDLNTHSKDSSLVSDIENNMYMGTEETNSAWLSWFRYFIDPFLEEFKDGIYSRSNNSNVTDNASDTLSNKTNVFRITNETVPAFLNISDSEQNYTDANKKTKFQCTGKNVTDNINATVKIVPSSRLLQLLNFDKNDTGNGTDCLVVMFYAPWCHFCAKTAPHYNALSRAFPQLDFVAVDTAQFSNLLARFATVSVPNILVFHQSRAAVKFNQTERTFENFISFVKNCTGLEPNTTVNVTEADYIGPIPSVPTDDTDIFLWIAWIFVMLYSSYMFIKSNKGQQWITRIRILWQEHQHID